MSHLPFWPKGCQIINSHKNLLSRCQKRRETWLVWMIIISDPPLIYNKFQPHLVSCRTSPMNRYHSCSKSRRSFSVGAGTETHTTGIRAQAIRRKSTRCVAPCWIARSLTRRCRRKAAIQAVKIAWTLYLRQSSKWRSWHRRTLPRKTSWQWRLERAKKILAALSGVRCKPLLTLVTQRNIQVLERKTFITLNRLITSSNCSSHTMQL